MVGQERRQAMVAASEAGRGGGSEPVAAREWGKCDGRWRGDELCDLVGLVQPKCGSHSSA